MKSNYNRQGNEGPSVVIVPEQKYTTCIGCKYYEYKLTISGRNPVYASNCIHTLTLRSFSVYGNLDQGYNGIVETPTWCPFKNPQILVDTVNTEI